MKIIETRGNEELARVYIAQLDDGDLIEMVDAVQPPIPRTQKWVLIVSSLKGCPVGCPFCDAGLDYHGRLTTDQILAQIDFLIRRRFPDGAVAIPKLKIQLARLGEPAYNNAVLDCLEELPRRYRAPGLMPCISTIAPANRAEFFERLLTIKNKLYTGGHFQLQFSLHTTDEESRRELIPVRTWSLAEIATYGQRFHAPGDRKVTLNFAPIQGLPLEPARLTATFSPDTFLVKLTPINPTHAAEAAGLRGALDPDDPGRAAELADRFRRHGFETLISIGELEENRIGSNCGMRLYEIARYSMSTSSTSTPATRNPLRASRASSSSP